MTLKRLHKTTGYSVEPVIDVLLIMRAQEKEQLPAGPGPRALWPQQGTERRFASFAAKALSLFSPQFTQRHVIP
jgi:hypothetical protein